MSSGASVSKTSVKFWDTMAACSFSARDDCSGSAWVAGVVGSGAETCAASMEYNPTTNRRAKSKAPDKASLSGEFMLSNGRAFRADAATARLVRWFGADVLSGESGSFERGNLCCARIVAQGKGCCGMAGGRVVPVLGRQRRLDKLLRARRRVPHRTPRRRPTPHR
ncbi:hypothetical protein GCM10009569_27060 [Arthrobacter russicus]